MEFLDCFKKQLRECYTWLKKYDQKEIMAEELTKGFYEAKDAHRRKGRVSADNLEELVDSETDCVNGELLNAIGLEEIARSCEDTQRVMDEIRSKVATAFPTFNSFLDAIKGIEDDETRGNFITLWISTRGHSDEIDDEEF